MPGGQNASAYAVIHGDLIIRVIVAVDDQMPSLAQKVMAIFAQVTQLNALVRLFIFQRQSLNRLQRRLIGNPAVCEINDYRVWILIWGKQL